MKKVVTIVLIFTALALSVSSVVTAQLDEDDWDWEYTIDFTSESGADHAPIGWEHGNINNGSHCSNNNEPTYSASGWRLNTDSSVGVYLGDVTLHSIEFHATVGVGGSLGNNLRIYDSDHISNLLQSGASGGDLALNLGYSSSPYSYDYTFDAPVDFTYGAVIIFMRCSQSGSTYIEDFTLRGYGECPFVDNCTYNEPPPPDLYKPLSSYEIESSYSIEELELVNNYISVASYSTIEHPSLTAMAVARNTGAKIHNAIDGTVTTVRPLQVSDCADFGLDGDQFFVDAGTGPDVDFARSALAVDCSFLFESNISVSFVVASLSQAVTNPLRDKYYVEILGSDELSYAYIAQNADAYVSQGLTVSGGCQIGEVVSVSSIGLELDVSPFSYQLTEGFAFLNGSDGEISSRLTIEPTNSQPCNQTPDFEQCVGDALFDTPSNWTLTSGTWMPGGGVRLPPGARVYTNPPLVLEADRNPELRIQAKSVGGAGQLTSAIGQTSDVFSLATTTTSHTIGAGSHQSDAGDLYTVSHKNTGSTTIEVTVSCLNFTTLSDGVTPDPDDYTPPPACLFENQSFNDGTGSWFVTNAESGEGSIRLTTGGTITQARELVGDSTDFAITVTSALWHYNSYSPDPVNVTGGVTIEYQINGGGWTTIDSEITYGQYAQNNNRVQVTDTFNSSTVSGDFQFRVTLASIPTGVRGVELLDVCINTGTDYDPDSEFEYPEGTEGNLPSEPPFNVSCNVVTTPSGNDFGQWITYHWLNLDNFFQCDLMVFLNALYDLIIDIYQTVGWGMRWMFALNQMIFEWLGSSFFPWLAGYLSNISPGQIVLQQEEQCHDLFCAITAMFDLIQSITDLINNIFTAIFDIIGTIIDLGVQLIGLILDAISNAQLFFSALVNSWLTSEPIENPYIPSCAVNPQQSGLCIFLWLIANTVLSGTGALFIPLLLSYGGISWLLFAVKEIKTVVLEAGQGL